MENPAKSKKHWIVLAIACGMASGSIGLVLNVIAVFYTPVSQSLGVYRGTFAFHATIASIALAFVSLIIPQLIDRFGWKPTLIVGVLLSFIGTSGMAFTTNMIVFYLLGAIRGAGASLFAMVPLTIIVNNWFEERNGLAMSLSFGFSGIAGAIFSPIFTSLIETIGWESAFFIKGILIMVLCLPAILYPYSLNPKDEGYLPYGEKQVDESERVTIKKNDRVPFSYANITFIALLVFAFLHTNIIGISQHLPGVGESFGLTTQVGGLMLSAVMIGNITFKLLIGTLSDAIGIVKSTVIIISLNLFAILFLILFQQPTPLIISSWLFGTVYAIPSVAFPLLSTKFFGRVQSTRVYPILSFMMGIGGAVSVTTVGYIFDFTGSYFLALLMGIIFNIINLGLLYLSVKSAQKTA